jgi:hypothetical protein
MHPCVGRMLKGDASSQNYEKSEKPLVLETPYSNWTLFAVALRAGCT